jgi:hypothetical protein
MAQKALLILAALWLMAGCGKDERRDPKAEIVTETLRHIEKAGAAGARLSKLSELTPAAQVAADLRLVAHDLNEWQREYRTLRAKMLLRNVPQDRHREVNRQYQTAVEGLKLKLEQAERRVSRRSDTRIFFVDLHRVRQIVREL